MVSLISIFVFSMLTTGSPLARTTCNFSAMKAGVAHELDTISSHSFSDANQIPLAPTASRTFVITPSELNIALPPVNVGITAGTVRTELVALATVLDANVPGGSMNGANYTMNQNNSVTVDYVQTNRIALPRVQVREIHHFDITTCLITSIFGYVNGALIDPSPLVNEDDNH